MHSWLAKSAESPLPIMNDTWPKVFPAPFLLGSLQLLMGPYNIIVSDSIADVDLRSGPSFSSMSWVHGIPNIKIQNTKIQHLLTHDNSKRECFQTYKRNFIEN